MYNICAIKYCAAMAQSVERILGKDEVTGSIPVSSSRKIRCFVKKHRIFCFILFHFLYSYVIIYFNYSIMDKYGLYIKRKENYNGKNYFNC